MIEIELDEPRWHAFVTSQADALPFHHPSWARVLTECYGFRGFALALVGAEKEVVAGVPIVQVSHPFGDLRWISLPFTDSCPPLGSAPYRNGLAAELEEARKGAGAAALEVRGFLRGATVDPTVDAVKHSLSLHQDAEAVAERFTPAVRRNVRSALRNRLRLHWGDSLRDISETYYSLHVQTRRRLGLPAQPRRLFRLLWPHVLEPGNGFVVLAYHGSTAVAGAVFLSWNGTVIFKYGASDPSFWRLRPNNLIFSEAIRWACSAGYHTFDFGRTAVSDVGVRRFKLGWGTVEQPLRYTILGGVKRKLPGRANPVVRGAIKCAPPWVTRIIGELFYKYEA